ncbi:methyltransferase [Caballeronia sp. GAFFF2]|uniref:class I SAM-dependent methyltransferase n=1 Tax=Caballeronia sp. GAFFF2 TaxID=2921741 RepID=UPI00202880A3|nr:methyltransferase [Caballeronia sp. GAFFF2]
MARQDIKLSERYHRDSDSGVWFRFGAATGDDDSAGGRVTAKLFAATDLSLFSEELRGSWTDLEMEYALSPVRANALRPFEAFLQADVLEIGAQYGVASRYLAESGARVIALEPVPMRASAAARRLSDLPFAQVVCESLRGLETEARFDVVTILNAAESADEWSDGGGGMRAMLRKAASLLRPDGLLILACENRFGLRWLASAKEPGRDAQLFTGLAKTETYDNADIFSKTSVLAALRELDFVKTEVAAAFPDHKLTRSLLTPTGLSANSGFEGSVLAAQSASRDPSLPPELHFGIEPAWRAAGRDRLIADLANSFVYAARWNPLVPCFSAEDLAYHYSTDRRAAFCKATSFTRKDGIRVERRKVGTALPDLNDSEFLFVLEDEAFLTGRSFDVDFEVIVSTPGWNVATLADFFRRYIELLLTESNARSCHVESPVHESTLLAGALLDFIPSNICIPEAAEASAQNYAPYDLEWRSKAPLPLGYMVFRALLNLSGFVSRYAMPATPGLLNRRTLFAEVYRELGLTFTADTCADYWQRESNFLAFATGNPQSVSAQEWFESNLPTGSPGHAVDHAQIKAEADERAVLEAAFAQRVEDLAALCNELDVERNELRSNLAISQSRADRSLDDLAETQERLEQVSLRVRRVQREFGILSDQYGRQSEQIAALERSLKEANAMTETGLRRIAVLSEGLRYFADRPKAGGLMERATQKILRLIRRRRGVG